MPKYAIRITTAVALLALVSGMAISLLMSGAGGANAFSRGVGIASDDAPNQYTTRCSNGTAVHNPTSNPGLVKDCATLLSIRATLDPDHYLGWSENAAITNVEYWHGVSVSGSPLRVRGLRLNQLGDLTGALPAKLGDLDALTSLGITGNGNFRLSRSNGSSNLTGSIPSELAKLSNLTTLNLSGNRLSGSIPSELGNIDSLETLSISNNRLTGCVPTSLRRTLGLVGQRGSWQGSSSDLYLLPYCAAQQPQRPCPQARLAQRLRQAPRRRS